MLSKKRLLFLFAIAIASFGGTYATLAANAGSKKAESPEDLVRKDPSTSQIDRTDKDGRSWGRVAFDKDGVPVSPNFIKVKIGNDEGYVERKEFFGGVPYRPDGTPTGERVCP
jgi:hypothetical protein